MDEHNADQIAMQDPEQDMKPKVTMAIIPELISRLYGMKASNIKELPSYDDRNFFFTAELDGSNPHVTSVHQHGYVMKILNSLQSSKPVIIEAFHAFQDYLRKRGISSQVPVHNKNGKEFTVEKIIIHEKGCDVEQGPFIVRVVTFIPGDTFFNTPYVPGSFYNVGKFVGKLHKAAKNFHHSFFDTYRHIWSLLEVPALKDFVYAVKDPKDAQVVNEVMEAFESEVRPLFDKFTTGIVHGDINEQNLVMLEVKDQSETPRELRIHDVSGLLDFSDGTMSYFVLDVAICISYLSIECEDGGQSDVGGHILAGYLKYFDLNDDEMSCLKTLACSRLCQSLVYGAHSYLQQPENDYLLTTSARGWPLLHKLWKLDNNELMQRWKNLISNYNDNVDD